MALSPGVLATWLVSSLFGGVVYDKAKTLLGEDAFLKITRKAKNEAIKREDNLIVWNKISELEDVKIKDPTKDFTNKNS